MRSLLHRRNLPLTILMTMLLGSFFIFFILGQGRKARERVPSKSSRAELVKGSQNQQLQKFNLTGFDDKGKTFWNLVGETAKIEPGQIVYLDQNVTLKFKEGTVVKTDHVRWSQEDGIMTTSSPVHAELKNAVVRGIGAVGKPKESFIQLNRDIDVVIDQGTHLVCQGPMKIFYKENKMVFYRKVKVTDQRGTLTANRMDVLFDPNEKKVDQIIAIGNVAIERGSDTTHSQRAIYTLATGSVRLEGSPEITLHQDSSKILDAPLRN